MNSHLRKLALGVGIVAIATVVVTIGASAHPQEPDDQGRRHAERRLGEQLHRHVTTASTRPASTSAMPGASSQPARAQPRQLPACRRRGRKHHRPRHRDVGAEADKRRQDLHVPPEAGHQVQPAGQPRVTSADFVTALDRLANPKNGGEYAFYFNVIKGWDAYAKGEASHISGISTPNKSHDHLQPHAARR